MQIDTRGRGKLSGFGTWLFSGPGGQQVTYSGWAADAPAYLAERYGKGHWFVVAA